MKTATKRRRYRAEEMEERMSLLPAAWALGASRCIHYWWWRRHNREFLAVRGNQKKPSLAHSPAESQSTKQPDLSNSQLKLGIHNPYQHNISLKWMRGADPWHLVERQTCHTGARHTAHSEMSSPHTGIPWRYFHLFKTKQLLLRKTNKGVDISRQRSLSKQAEHLRLGCFLPYLDKEMTPIPPHSLVSYCVSPPGAISNSALLFCLFHSPWSGSVPGSPMWGSQSLCSLSFWWWLPSVSTHPSIHTKPGPSAMQSLS